MLAYFVDRAATVLLPPPALSERADGLWRTTCFELFLKRAGASSYAEYNFSPSTRWAAYWFDGYREGMRAMPCAAPPIVERGEGFVTRAAVHLGDSPAGALLVGLSAVIEEKDGTKSYWALAHPPGKPDFHDPACFALELPASDRA